PCYYHTRPVHNGRQTLSLHDALPISAVTKAKDALKYAQIRLTMMKRGLDEKLVSQKEYEDAEALESAARNDVVASESQLRVLLQGSRPEDIEATKAQIDQLRTDRGHLQKQRRMLTVYR